MLSTKAKPRGCHYKSSKEAVQVCLDVIDVMDVTTIKKISNELDSVLDKRPEVSKDELGTLKGAKAQFFVEPGAVPKFHKLRPVPHAIKRAIEQELDRLENMGVLEKVRFSN